MGISLTAFHGHPDDALGTRVQYEYLLLSWDSVLYRLHQFTCIIFIRSEDILIIAFIISENISTRSVFLLLEKRKRFRKPGDNRHPPRNAELSCVPCTLRRHGCQRMVLAWIVGTCRRYIPMLTWSCCSELDFLSCFPGLV